MELIYKKRLVHFLGQSETEQNGQQQHLFMFRDGSGEKVIFELKSDNVPNTCFGCSTNTLERGLQEILDTKTPSSENLID